MKKIQTLFGLFLLPFSAMVQNDQTVYSIEPQANDTVYYTGDLAEGNTLNDLSWAWNSANACFPETQRSKFTGHHVFYTCIIPRYSELEITVIPNDPNADFSIYAYEIGENSTAMVPDLQSCIRCEADHRWDRPKRGKVQNHTRTVSDLLALNSPYRVVIGVTGANGLAEGTFTLRVVMKSR